MSLDFLIFDRIRELMRLGHGCGLSVCLDSFNNTVMIRIAHLCPVNPVQVALVWKLASRSAMVKVKSAILISASAWAGCMGLSITSSISYFIHQFNCNLSFFGPVKWICQLSGCSAVINTDYPVMKMLHEMIMWDVFVLFLSDKSYHCINLQTYWVQSAILSWTGRQKANYCQDFVMTPHHLFSMLLKHFWITEDSLTMLLSPSHLAAVVCWCLLLSPHRFPHTPGRGGPTHCGQWPGKKSNN